MRWLWLLLALGYSRRTTTGAGGPVTGSGLSGTQTGTKQGTTTGGGPKQAIPAAAMPINPVPRPPGSPFGRACGSGEYNAAYWPTRASIKNTFAQLGYAVPAGETMNPMGPNGVVGGGDDVSSAIVAAFQDDYNFASSANLLGGDAGGLDLDGFVGPCVLNGLEKVLMYFDGANDWLGAVGAKVQGGG